MYSFRFTDQHVNEPVFCLVCGSRFEREWHEGAFDQILETAYCPTCNVLATEDREHPSLYGLPSAREKLTQKIAQTLREGYIDEYEGIRKVVQGELAKRRTDNAG